MSAFDFKNLEERILAFWHNNHIFEKSLENRAKAKRFVFFEGPPTANGRPGIHHFIGRAFKDLFSRYKAMRGFFVLRKAGWDTHGLPVEIEVEKALGFKNKKDIEEYGIAKFNKKCKESVWRYKTEWEQMTRKMGFWVDMKDPYVTYESSYMESLWHILKTAWDKKLLYRAHKVVPFCTRCGTPLSSHEVAQGYKTITDQSVTVKFKVKSEKLKVAEGKTVVLPKNTFILAWTTTPWTLPGNVALAVGEKIKYAIFRIKNKEEEEYYIAARELVGTITGEENYEIMGEISGKELVGIEYEPLFPVKALKSETSYKVYLADFVSTDEGTGVVHTAVMYGEDDYKLGMQVGLPAVHTVTEQGLFTGVSKELDGKYVKSPETEKLILDELEKNGNILKTEKYEHEYPHCWRCSSPLLYYAKDSWFIRMSALRDQLLKNNKTVTWIPENVKDGRFGQWLKEVKDWAISRERYWGTPLPIFTCIKCKETDMVGSFKELEKRNVKIKNRYFIMRHGLSQRREDTDSIASSILSKDTYHLVPKGIRQAQSSVKWLQSECDNLDVIIASPFIRTKETADITGKAFHRKVLTDKRLSEVGHPESCDGKPHKVGVLRARDGTITCDVHGRGSGESYESVRERLMEFMRETETKYRGKNILLITHGLPLWLMEHLGDGRTMERMYEEWHAGNWLPALASVKELTWRMIPRNDLGELDAHRPFVDEIQLQCKNCKASMKRIPDLVDVWFDSGGMPYAQWHWPFENKKLFKEQFPADFIGEAIDQTRGWFYTLLAISTLMDKGAPYKNVLCYGHVLDEKGQKMSKSRGNAVSPKETMETFGVDATRWYFYTLNAPGDYKSFVPKDIRERLTGFLGTIQNCIRFYELYAKDESSSQDVYAKSGKNLFSNSHKSSQALDAWVLSRLNSLAIKVGDSLDAYDYVTSSRAIERFVVDDLSNWWLRRSRKRTDAIPLLRALLFDVSRLCAPFIPFTAEDMYLRLQSNRKSSARLAEDSAKRVVSGQLPVSVHLCDWPVGKKSFIDNKLEESMVRVRDIVSAGLAFRKDNGMKVRQPLRAVTISGKKLEEKLEMLIAGELNVKNVEYKKTGELELDMRLTHELVAEGYARELIRQIQDMRKESGSRFDDKVYCQWFTENEELSGALTTWQKVISEDSALSSFVKLRHDKKTFDVEKEWKPKNGVSVWVGIKRS